MDRSSVAILEFDPVLNELGSGKRLTDGLSVVCQVGRSLWVASDEALSLERLTRKPPAGNGPWHYGQHQRFVLADYLSLPGGADEEADIEGLAYDGGYLWLIGSHSLKRKKPHLEEGPSQARRQLARVTDDGNRYLLARIPLAAQGDEYRLVDRLQGEDRLLFAASLAGNKKGNELTRALSEDKHLGAFLALPGKDNGFDIEGLAVAGERLFIGLRGPVLRGWAVILEIALREDADDSELHLEPIGGAEYRKHFLQLDGLGIRDLCVDGDDLLILAGPTMDLDGPVQVFRWPGGTRCEEEAMVAVEGLQRVLDVPFGKGVEHAEGMALGPSDDGLPASLLVVYDSAAPKRMRQPASVEADIFNLP